MSVNYWKSIANVGNVNYNVDIININKIKIFYRKGGKSMNGISSVNSSMDYGKIASGKKINSAADDASGLAISEKLKSQTNGMDVGRSNAKDGVNVLNIADGALGGIQDSLQRIRELSVQAGGLRTSSDLKAIQQEINGLMKGIQGTAEGTEFNTMKLLDGSKASMNIATNPDGSGMEIQLANSTLDALGLNGYDVTGKFDISVIDKALERVSESRSSMGAATNALGYASNYNSNASLQLTSAQSRIEDLDIPKAISEQKKNETLNTYKNAMLRKQMDQNSLMTRML